MENDAYGELRYWGEPLPAIKQLDSSGGTVLLRSFSKVSFPGLRVGWAVGPKALIGRLRRAKETSDLHTDQLSQAVLLEFAESGRIEAHRARVLKAAASPQERRSACPLPPSFYLPGVCSRRENKPPYPHSGGRKDPQRSALVGVRRFRSTPATPPAWLT